MTIQKTYCFQIEKDGDDDYELHDVRIKARTRDEACDIAEAKYADDHYVVYRGRLNQARRRNKYDSPSYTPPIGLRRYGGKIGRYVFQHKGKKIRGRKNYPTPRGGWAKIRAPLTFSWTESYSKPFSDFLKDWMGGLCGLHLGVSGLVNLRSAVDSSLAFIPKEFLVHATSPDSATPPEGSVFVPIIKIDSLAMLTEDESEGQCFACVPADAVDALGRAFKDIKVGDTVTVKLGDENGSLAARALACAERGDYLGMMLHAKDLPGIEKIRGISFQGHGMHNANPFSKPAIVEASYRGTVDYPILENDSILQVYRPGELLNQAVELFAPSERKSDYRGFIAQNLGVTLPLPDTVLDVEATCEHIADVSVKDMYPDVVKLPDPNKD